MTGNTYSLCIFLFTFILAFLLFMMLATLLNAAHPSAMRLLISGRRSPACVTVLPRYTYRSTFSMVFPSTATVDVVALSLSINHLGLTQVHAEAYWFAGEVYVTVSEHALQLLWRLSYHTSSAKIKCDRCIGVNSPAFGGTVPHFHQMSRVPRNETDVLHFF